MTSSSKLSSRLTSARARSSAMLCRSRSSSISSRAPGEGSCAYRGLLCQRPPIVATHQSMGCQPRIIEVIPVEAYKQAATLDPQAVAPKERLGQLAIGQNRLDEVTQYADELSKTPDGRFVGRSFQGYLAL